MASPIELFPVGQKPEADLLTYQPSTKRRREDNILPRIPCPHCQSAFASTLLLQTHLRNCHNKDEESASSCGLVIANTFHVRGGEDDFVKRLSVGESAIEITRKLVNKWKGMAFNNKGNDFQQEEGNEINADPLKIDPISTEKAFDYPAEPVPGKIRPMLLKGGVLQERTTKSKGGHCCNICKQSFITEDEMKEHKTNDHKLIKCTRCNFLTRSFKHFESHIVNCKRPQQQKPIICQQCLYCPFACVMQSDLHKHIQERHRKELPKIKLVSGIKEEEKKEKSIESQIDMRQLRQEVVVNKINFSSAEVAGDKAPNKVWSQENNVVRNVSKEDEGMTPPAGLVAQCLPFHCKLCEYSSRSIESVRDHIRSTHLKKPLSRLTENKDKNSEDDKGQLAKNGVRNVKQTNFHMKRQLQREKEEKEESPARFYYTCRICLFQSQEQGEFRVHMRKVHNNDSDADKSLYVHGKLNEKDNVALLTHKCKLCSLQAKAFVIVATHLRKLHRVEENVKDFVALVEDLKTTEKP